MYLAEDPERVMGYIGGHLTGRFGCDGELQYLCVSPESRRSGVAAGLLDAQGAARICVDEEPANARARAFYFSRGTTELDSHWLVWDDIGKRIAR
jgi:ribosomal protein S18 acetylase RimI-like enzyme